MALKKCKECGRPVSTKAAKCPACGAPNGTVAKRAATGCCGVLTFLLLGVVALSYCAPAPSPRTPQADEEGVAAPEPAAAPPTYPAGHPVSIGYFTHEVFGAEFEEHLSLDPSLDRAAKHRWLFVGVSVRNDDPTPSAIPPYDLVDEDGRRYGNSLAGIGVMASFNALFSDLGPGEERRGIALFDVPPGPEYMIELSGGLLSKQRGRVPLAITGD